MNGKFNFFEQFDVKDSKSWIILIILVCILCALVGGYIINNKYAEDSESNYTRKKIQNLDNKNEISLNTSEIEIEDQTLINSLNEKVSYLVNIGRKTANEKGEFFAKDATKRNFTSYAKLGAIVLYSDIISHKLTHEVIPYNIYSNHFPDLAATKSETDFQFLKEGDDYQVKASDIDNIYYEIFGEKVVNHQTNLACPSVSYDSETAKYLVSLQCAQETTSSLLTYNYKYSKDEDNAYVYVSVGVKGFDKETSSIPVIYSDYEETTEFLRDENVLNYQISSTDYEKFSKYKITFILSSDNNYHFEKVEKINE